VANKHVQAGTHLFRNRTVQLDEFHASLPSIFSAIDEKTIRTITFQDKNISCKSIGRMLNLSRFISNIMPRTITRRDIQQDDLNDCIFGAGGT
jgi:hypothetical protein